MVGAKGHERTTLSEVHWGNKSEVENGRAKGGQTKRKNKNLQRLGQRENSKKKRQKKRTLKRVGTPKAHVFKKKKHQTNEKKVKNRHNPPNGGQKRGDDMLQQIVVKRVRGDGPHCGQEGTCKGWM